ncbi:MAG TPA: LptA/OstA family protein, partial [Acetobacteraceae bacterium]
MRRLVLLALLLASPAAAQPIDLSSGGPVEVTAQGGFEWRDAEQMVIAEGQARAVRGNVTVTSDRMIARFRRKGGAPTAAAAAPGPAAPAALDTGDNEVYRLEAVGNVHIYTPTDQAQGDRAIYDIDQAVLVMTGRALKLTSPQQVLTARDSIEYWSQKRMAVARGNAVVVTTDARRISADTLVAYLTDPAPGTAAGGAKTAPRAGAPDEGLAASGKLQRMEAYGNVEVRTVQDTVRGDRGLYMPDTSIARVLGNVRITHNNSQINGRAADVNMKTGVARILSDPGERVQGLIMPNEANAAPDKANGDKPGS